MLVLIGWQFACSVHRLALRMASRTSLVSKIVSPTSGGTVLKRRDKEEEFEFDDTVPNTITGYQQDSKPAILANKVINSFIWTTSPQPHAIRRRLILEKYPAIEQLYGADPS